MSRLEIFGVEGIGEIGRAADLAGDHLRRRRRWMHGDVVVVTQKIVSKAEGAMVEVDPTDPLSHKPIVERESRRILRRRGDLSSARPNTDSCAPTPASTCPTSTVAGRRCCPMTPTARHAASATASGASAASTWASIVSDTFGRPWRRGVTDVAIGAAGLVPVLDLRGTQDSYGRELMVTEVCIVDEIAAAAELVMGKASGVPVAVVRGVDPSGSPRRSGGGVPTSGPLPGRRPVPLTRQRTQRSIDVGSEALETRCLVLERTRLSPG